MADVGEQRNSLKIVECMSPAGCSQHCLPLLLGFVHKHFIKCVILVMYLCFS